MKDKLSRNIRIVRYILYRETLLDKKELLWTFLGSFCGIGLIGFMQHHILERSDLVFLIGSFGASSVLIFGAIQSPLAQPRNLVGGHILSAVIGVSCNLLFEPSIVLAASMAVSLSIVAMQITHTLHPPGGATALIAVIGSDQIKALGWWYVLYPVFSGVLILFLSALLFNNLTGDRQYPSSPRFTRIIRRKKLR